MKISSTEPTKEKIILELRNRGQLTVSEISDAVRITPIAVRHHLSSLQAEGMIEVREERHGVGRPRQIYKLTPQALDRNPARLVLFANLLLDQLKEHLPAETVKTLLMDVAFCMAAEWKEELVPLPLPQKLNRLAELLTQEGFVARVEQAGPGRYCLTELACPYSRISLSHPDICAVDEAMISRALGMPVERTSCIRSGSEVCSFLIGVDDEEAGDG